MELKHGPRLGLDIRLTPVAVTAAILSLLISISGFLYLNLGHKNTSYGRVEPAKQSQDTINQTQHQQPFTLTNNIKTIITAFHATTEKSQVVITWATDAEHANSHFVLQTCTDKTHFESLDVIPGSGSTNEPNTYSYVDDRPNRKDGVVYYRLKQVNYNGKFTFSKVVEVLNTNVEQINVSPQIASDRISVQSNGWFNTQLIDQYGNIVNTITKAVDQTYFNISDLPAGSYVVKVSTSDTIETFNVEIKH